MDPTTGSAYGASAAPAPAGAPGQRYVARQPILDRLQKVFGYEILFRNGMPAAVAREKLVACMKPKEIFVRLDLGQGRQSARVWTCDLSKEYVSINADYHT